MISTSASCRCHPQRRDARRFLPALRTEPLLAGGLPARRLQIAPRLTLTLGLRETWDQSHYGDGYAYLYAGGILGGTPETPLATTVPCYNAAGCAYDPNARFGLHGSNNALTGRAALSYKFDGGLLAYASYNRGYRSGAFNGGAYTSQTGINLSRPKRSTPMRSG
jgi:outer membrane receptor protein involved in Fe transport